MDPDEIILLVGRRVRSLRRAAGLSQQTLAEMAEIDSTYLGALERGDQKNPSLRIIVRLADALGVSLEALTDATADQSAPTLRKLVRARLVDLDAGALRELLAFADVLKRPG